MGMPSISGKAEAHETFSRLFRLIPDLHVVVHRWAEGDDVLFIEFTLVGTFGGGEISWPAVDRFLLRDGLVAERVSYFDPMPLFLTTLRRRVGGAGSSRQGFRPSFRPQDPEDRRAAWPPLSRPGAANRRRIRYRAESSFAARGSATSAVHADLRVHLPPPALLEFNRRRYGDVVKFSTLFDPCFVMVFDPESVKQVFPCASEQLRAGEANAPLGPVVGALGAAARWRGAPAPAPPNASAIPRAADARVRGGHAGGGGSRDRFLAGGRELRAVAVDAVADARRDHARGLRHRPRTATGGAERRIRAVVDPVGSRPALLLMVLSGGRFGIGGSMERFEERKRALDDLIYEEIATRRSVSDLEERKDVLSMLLLA